MVNRSAIPFGDMGRNVRRLRPEIDAAVARVLDSGWFILGPELRAFESELAQLAAVRHAIGVGNGTDAIALTLTALGVGPGDEVITTPLTAAFTALAITQIGAVPVFADVDPDSLNLDPAAAAAAVTPRTRAILPVHLYGRAAQVEPLLEVAAANGLVLVEDAAQAIGVRPGGRALATFASAATLSFYPTKNLGAYGDAGAILTNDGELAARLSRLRDGGQTARYVHAELGVNSRLDELQAAILRVRLGRLPSDTDRRRHVAGLYDAAVRASRCAQPPAAAAVEEHVHHLYVLRHPNRPALQSRLAAAGVGTAIHYPTPVHAQPAFRDFGQGPLPVAERAANQVLSLPLYPELTDSEVDQIATTLAGLPPPP